MTKACFLLTLLAVVLAPPAWAQGVQPTPPVSFGVGAGVSRSEHTDLRFPAASWEADGLFRLSHRASLQLLLGQWRHTERETVLDVPIQGPSGPLGRADRLDQQTNRVTTTFEANYFAGARVGRASVLAGGGVGVMMLGRTFRQSLSGCSVSVARFCGTTEQQASTVSGTVQGGAMVSVPVANRLSLYGTFRMLLPLRDVGLLTTRGTAGVRFSFGE